MHLQGRVSFFPLGQRRFGLQILDWPLLIPQRDNARGVHVTSTLMEPCSSAPCAAVPLRSSSIFLSNGVTVPFPSNLASSKEPKLILHRTVFPNSTAFLSSSHWGSKSQRATQGAAAATLISREQRMDPNDKIRRH